MRGDCYQYLCVTYRGMDLVPPCLDYNLIQTHCRPVYGVYCLLCVVLVRVGVVGGMAVCYPRRR